MNFLRKLPDRQVKIVIILITLIILVCSYFVGFQRFSNKAEALEKENKSLTSKKNELQIKYNNKDKVAIDTDNLNKEADALIDKFPSGLTQDKNIMFVNSLTNHAGMNVSLIGLGGTDILYTEAMSMEMGTAAPVNTGQPIMGDANEDALLGGDGPIGYKTSVNISYQTTYEGLKKCIDYVNDYVDRMNIPSFTVSFDNTTGNLSGTMTIDIYALGGIDKEFDDAVIDGINIGTDNIFGTFELPMDNLEEEAEDVGDDDGEEVN